MDVALSHLWIAAPYQRDRTQALLDDDPAINTTYRVDCHRNLRGPYTGTGALLRAIVPEVARAWPEHTTAHATEILSIAPELKSVVTASRETLTSLAIPEERTRFYSRLRTLRLTHGIIDFLLRYLTLANLDHCTIVFENVHAADTLDQEFIATLLRRADPHFLSVVVCSLAVPLPGDLQKALATYAQPLRPQPLSLDERSQDLMTWDARLVGEWEDWLLQSTEGWRGAWEPLRQLTDACNTSLSQDCSFEEGIRLLIEACPAEQRRELARAYIASNCTTDDPLQRVAYDLLEEGTRRQWHDERAVELEARDEWSLCLGAIPYQRERGVDPADTGARALQIALDYCINMGYYEATIDFGQRGRRVIDWVTQKQYYWTFTTKMTTSLAAMSRPAEAEALYKEARALSSDPSLHMQAAYATAMLYTRHYEPEKRDQELASGWINEAIAIAQLLPDEDRDFHIVFNQNGRALIELHRAHPQEALRLVSEGLERLNSVLAPDQHLLHRSVLIYNRAQVYAGLGQLELALDDFTEVIKRDPHYSEYYFDRGNLYRRLGRHQEALQDYVNAIRFSPPYPEAYYNRGAVLSLLGRDDEAFADFNYVLELDPDYVDALINRASSLYERGEYAASRRDIEHGLELAPGNPQLLCTLGLLEMEEGRSAGANRAFTAALERDPLLFEAWTNRAVLAYEQGNIDAAISDLTRTLELKENATILSNRALAYQSQARWQEAIADYSHSLDFPDCDTQETLYQRGLCYEQLGDTSRARQDFAAHLALGPSSYAEELNHLDVTPSAREVNMPL